MLLLLPFAFLSACADKGDGTTETGDTSGAADSDSSRDSATDSAADSSPDTGDTADSQDTAQVVPPSGLELTVDPHVSVMLHATWVDPGSDASWLEYQFDGGEWLVAPIVALGEAVILGVPQNRTVTARVAATIGGETVYSEPASGRTGALPRALALPTITALDEALISEAPYVMVSVGSGDYWYAGPYDVEIFDRSGQIVWYHSTTEDQGLITLMPSVSLDGTHIWFESADLFGFSPGAGTVTRMTLDDRWSQVFNTPDLGQGISEGPDGSFFMEHRDGGAHGVDQMDALGGVTSVWDCDAVFESLGLEPGYCLLNSVAWDEARGTVLASQFETSTIFEVDVASGAVVRQMGQITVGDPYTFDPPESNFAYQHYPHWTEEGTLLLSTHQPCDASTDRNCGGNAGLNNLQLAAEYVVDDATQTLTRTWSYTSTDPWATQAGEAQRLDNGNLLQGFGQDGTLEEITPDGVVAWRVDWPKDTSGYRLLGHATPIHDLYALNQGW